MLKSNIDVFLVTSFLCSLKVSSNRVSKEVSMEEKKVSIAQFV